MPVSTARKSEVRNSLIGYDRPYQHTAAAGIVLFNDGSYSVVERGTSGTSFGGTQRITVVKNHHNNQITKQKKAGNDAEVHVLNELGRIIIGEWPNGVNPTDVFLYVVGPKPICGSCKHLIHKFEQSFNVTVEKEYIQNQH